jgi:hypothetical protein
VADPRRYLLPSERPVIQVRRHWAILARDTVQTLLLLIGGIFLVRVFAAVSFLHMLAVYFTVFVVVRWAWIMGDWYVERFIVTDKRVLLITGIATRKVAIMPLIKVTDLTYNRTATGLTFGYGEFVVESAGQDQALSRINYIPQPEKLYIQMSELLFGGDKGQPAALPSPAEREAELEAGHRAMRRRRRPWTGWRRRRAGTSPVSTRGEPLGGLDDLLARRDTLLAERESRLRRERGEPDDPTAELPRIHDPRRDRGDTPPDPPRDPPRRPPQPRWGTDEPPHAPPVDPADD